MGFNVKFKSTLLPEDFPALQTLVGLPAGVDLQVHPQTGEGLGTQWTRVRTLSCMSAGVNGQQTFGAETLPTQLARVPSPPWLCRCSFNSLEERKAIPHSVHGWFFSRRCMHMCLIMLLTEVFPHMWHLKSCSLVCVRWWMVREDLER